MGTAIQGLQRGFTQSISVLGTDVIYVQRFDWLHQLARGLAMMQNRRRPITLAQARETGTAGDAGRAPWRPIVDTTDRP